MDLAVLLKLFTALKDWLRIHVVLGHISDCKLIFHQKRAAKHHKHVSCLPESDQRKKTETHSDTPTIMIKKVTKFLFFKKRRQYFSIHNQISQYLHKKNVYLFLLLCTELKCIPETCFFFSCFFLLFLHHLILPCPLSSLSSILFCLVVLFSKLFIGLQFSCSCTFSNYLLILFYNPLWLSIFICLCFSLHIYS